MVVYREPVTGHRSRGIVNRHPAINNKLATKPAPNPNPKLLVPKKRKTDRQITNRLNVDAILINHAYCAWSPQPIGVPHASHS